MLNKKQNSDDNSKRQTTSVLAKQYSGFVFLVSMKYLNNEEKSKDIVFQIFKKMNNPLTQIDDKNIKVWLYNETKNMISAQTRHISLSESM